MRKTLLLTALTVLIVSIGSATTISNEEVTVDLEDNTVTSKVEIEDLTTETFNYQTSHPVRNLVAEINGQRADCEVTELAVGANINCDTVLTENFTVELTYRTEGLATSQNGVSTFRYSQSIYRPIENYRFKVILPEGTGVVDSEDATTAVIEPSSGELGNMEGRRFFVQWNTSPSLGESEDFRVMFEPLQEPPRENSVILPGSILALALILGITYFVYRRKNSVRNSNILEELGDDEKMVVEMLQEQDGEMLQKDIVEDSEYSKAKISGVVSELVENNIVSKEKEGRSNKVSLMDKFRD